MLALSWLGGNVRRMEKYSIIPPKQQLGNIVLLTHPCATSSSVGKLSLTFTFVGTLRRSRPLQAVHPSPDFGPAPGVGVQFCSALNFVRRFALMGLVLVRWKKLPSHKWGLRCSQVASQGYIRNRGYNNSQYQTGPN